MLFRYVSLLFSLCCLTGCSFSSSSDAPESWQIESLAELDTLVSERPLVESPSLTHRVERVVTRLNAGSPGAWPQILIVHDAAAYALTFPAAETVVLSDSLLRTVRGDDELAFILAHEATHIFAGHSIENPQISARTRRRFEEEADRGALTTVRRAGYSPRRAIMALITVPRAWEIANESESEESPLQRYVRMEKELGR